MSGFVFETTGDQNPLEGVRQPITHSGSKSVILAAESEDTIEIIEIVQQFVTDAKIPGQLITLDRHVTYFGPKLTLKDEQGRDYLLTAPGPDHHLFLWCENTNNDGFRHSWKKAAEIQATFSDQKTRYHICPNCNKPLKSPDHKRLGFIGRCPHA